MAVDGNNMERIDQAESGLSVCVLVVALSQELRVLI
jgi:hypothetical protein